MLEIKKIKHIEQLNELKVQYFLQASAPLDGMWHFGFVPMADHFGFYQENSLLGYCCINSEGYMLQFYLSPLSRILAADLFYSLTKQSHALIGSIKGAFVSTAESAYLSLCLDQSASLKVNALMYQQGIPQQTRELLTMQLATEDQLTIFVAFSVANIAAPEQWLIGYFKQLIEREELFGYWNNGKLLASGECRVVDEFQCGYADLRMIVTESNRGKGIATRALQYLVEMAEKKGLKSICSTEIHNIAAQKAISRAGFITDNRIIKIEFLPL